MLNVPVRKNSSGRRIFTNWNVPHVLASGHDIFAAVVVVALSSYPVSVCIYSRIHFFCFRMQEEANEAENPAQNEGEGRTDEYGFARGTPKKTADGVADSKEPEPTTTTGGDEDGIQLRVADSKESSDLITTRTQVDIQDVEGEEVVDL